MKILNFNKWKLNESLASINQLRELPIALTVDGLDGEYEDLLIDILGTGGINELEIKNIEKTLMLLDIDLELPIVPDHNTGKRFHRMSDKEISVQYELYIQDAEFFIRLDEKNNIPKIILEVAIRTYIGDDAWSTDDDEDERWKTISDEDNSQETLGFTYTGELNNCYDLFNVLNTDFFSFRYETGTGEIILSPDVSSGGYGPPTEGNWKSDL
tara:strand:+ start:1600 stop:2238 length:639 start_codon:yes stop_codon:yes gene_type:complete